MLTPPSEACLFLCPLPNMWEGDTKLHSKASLKEVIKHFHLFYCHKQGANYTLCGAFSINNITFRINADGMSLVMNNSRMTKHFFKTEQKKKKSLKLFWLRDTYDEKIKPQSSRTQSLTPSSVLKQWLEKINKKIKHCCTPTPHH